VQSASAHRSTFNLAHQSSDRKMCNQAKPFDPLIIGGMGLEIASRKGGKILVEIIMRG
jgi:hypothetical protein